MPAWRAARVTVSLDGTDRDLVLDLGQDRDPVPVLAAVADSIGPADLVVDRTGIPLRGAVAGRDLLAGDRLVARSARHRPLLVGVDGPLLGARATVDRELVLGRGGRLGSTPLDDPEISREHLRLTPTPGAVRATDPGSTNGTRIDDRELRGTVDLVPGDRIGLGASTLVLVGDPPRGPHLEVLGTRVRWRTPPAPPEPAPTLGDDPPPPPAPPPPPRFRLWLVLLAALVGAVAAAVSGSGTWLLVSAWGPGLTGLAWFVDRRNDRARHRLHQRDWRAATSQDVDRLRAQVEERLRWLRRQWPDPAHVAAAVAGWSPGLWSRATGHPAFLSVRVGEASEVLRDGGRPPEPAGHGAEPADGPYPQDVADAVHAARTGQRVPVTVDLRVHRVVGLTGPPGLLDRHLAAWLLHLAALHRPADLALDVVPEAGSPLLAGAAAAARWLPHAGAGRCGGDHPWPVALVESGSVAPAGGAGTGHADGTVVWVAAPGTDLPPGCTATVELDTDGTATVRTRAAGGTGRGSTEGGDVHRVDADLLEEAAFEELARTLAPLTSEDPDATGEAPRSRRQP